MRCVAVAVCGVELRVSIFIFQIKKGKNSDEHGHNDTGRHTRGGGSLSSFARRAPFRSSSLCSLCSVSPVLWGEMAVGMVGLLQRLLVRNYAATSGPCRELPRVPHPPPHHLHAQQTSKPSSKPPSRSSTTVGFLLVSLHSILANIFARPGRWAALIKLRTPISSSEQIFSYQR